MLKYRIPVLLAVFIGLITLGGLLFSIPQINRIVLTWGMVLAAFALLFGIVNLFAVHARRLIRQQNLYSGVLLISMMLFFVAAMADQLAVTTGLVETLFALIQVPLEAALSSMLAFFLLFTGIQMLRRERTFWSMLFISTAMLTLLLTVVAQLTAVPQPLANVARGLKMFLEDVLVTSGMRGLLIGIALGVITLSIRLLMGAERPYSK